MIMIPLVDIIDFIYGPDECAYKDYDHSSVPNILMMQKRWHISSDWH